VSARAIRVVVKSVDKDILSELRGVQAVIRLVAVAEDPEAIEQLLSVAGSIPGVRFRLEAEVPAEQVSRLVQRMIALGVPIELEPIVARQPPETRPAGQREAQRPAAAAQQPAAPERPAAARPEAPQQRAPAPQPPQQQAVPQQTQQTPGSARPQATPPQQQATAPAAPAAPPQRPQGEAGQAGVQPGPGQVEVREVRGGGQRIFEFEEEGEEVDLEKAKRRSASRRRVSPEWLE